jgi:hypothetical protein
MANIVGKIGWRITTIAVGIPIGIAAKKGVERAWLAARPDDPPHRPKDPNARIGDALGWAALSAVGIAATQLLTRRWATAVWRALTGAEPPGSAAEAAAADSAPAEGATVAAG